MMIENKDKKEEFSRNEEDNEQPLNSTNGDDASFLEFVPPVRKKFEYDSQNGLATLFKPKEPKWDANREEHLQKVAKLNAFTDFLKHLGAFAGGGYAPVEKRQENQNVLRAFAELDKLRDTYKSDVDKYNNQVFNLNLRDYANQMDRADREYNREYEAGLRNWDAQQRGAQWKKEKEFRENERKEAQKFTREENQKNRNDRKEALQGRLNNELKKAELKSQNKEPFLTISTPNGKVGLTRSDAIAIGNRIEEIYKGVLEKKSSGEELTAEDEEILKDISLLTKSLGENEALSDNAIRKIAEKYYPIVTRNGLTHSNSWVVDVTENFNHLNNGGTR